MTLFDLLPILAIVVVMYFTLWRPQQQERAAHEAMIASLSKGDRVVTVGGLHGTIVEVALASLAVEIAPSIRVTIEKSAIVRKSADPVSV